MRNAKLYQTLAAVALLTAPLLLMSNFNGPPQAVSGSPLENGMNCTFCHTGAPNSGGGSIAISGVDAYVPGQTYTIEVQITDQNSGMFGFQLTALTDNNKQAGTLKAGTHTKLYKWSSNTYIEHNAPVKDGKFSFEWTAPATDEGTVTFYASGNAANGDNSSFGDHIYVTKQSAMSATAVEDIAGSVFSLYPNPSNGRVTIAMNEGKQLTNVQVVDMQGKIVHQANSLNQPSLTIENLETGVYILKVQVNNDWFTRRLAIQ
ncbi:T9SS type A sorting domain-containing protein [bacterium]|nr:T9SS type A sorting domain-containing protein [bacterium]